MQLISKTVGEIEMQIKNYLLQFLLTFVLLLTYCASPEDTTEEVVGPDDSALALGDSEGALEMELDQENSEEENFAADDNEAEVQEEGELDSELMGEEGISEENFAQEENEVAEQIQESESIDVVTDEQESTGEELASEEGFAPEGAVLDEPAAELAEEEGLQERVSEEGFAPESETLAEQGSEESQVGLDMDKKPVELAAQEPARDDTDSYDQEEEIDDQDSMEVADQGSDLQESQVETQVAPEQEVVAPEQEVVATTTPETGTFIEYVVQAGDSLSKIAQRVYQDKFEWKKIQAANAQFIDNPDAIFPGDVLKIPVESAPAAEEFVTEFKKSEPLSQDKVSVSVEKGDSLTTIAKSQMGDGGLWRLIWTQLVDTVPNPDFITPGQVLEFRVLGSASTAAGGPQ
jgi:nucleoid-associated protein YgaU